MPITIGSNIASLRAQRRLNEGGAELSRVYERLSSGQRINRASDDAAGLSVASSLRATSRVYSQAVRNITDGISVLSIADGAIAQLSTISQHISELAEQSASGVYSNTQRGALDREAQSLAAEYTRIIETTQFNGTSLLGAQSHAFEFQVGSDSDQNSRIRVDLTSASTTTTPTGTFDAAMLTGASGRMRDVNVADFDGDGNLDLIGLGDSSAPPNPGGGDLFVRFGNGDGTFQDTVGIGVQGRNGIGVGDLSGDGALDIAYWSNDTKINVLKNQGDGTFTSTQVISDGMS